jgi:hypothetical protein
LLLFIFYPVAYIRTLPAAYHPTSHYWHSSKAKQGWSLDGSPDATGSGVGGPVGGPLSSGLKKISQIPRAVIGDIALCRVLCFRSDVKQVSRLSVVTKDPMALIVRVGVLKLVSWLISNLAFIPSQSSNHPQFTIGSFLLSHVTIPQVVAVNENVFSVNLPGKIRDK